MGVLYTSAALGLVCLILSLPALGKPGRRLYAVLAALFMLVLNTATDLRKIFPAIPAFPGRYNWTGKLLEFLVGIVAILLLTGVAGWQKEEFGLKFSFASGTGRDVLRFLVPLLLFDTIVLWFLIPGQTPTMEDHFFQIFVPGVTEELAFRGVLMALLDRAFPARVRVVGADLGWSAISTAILFGLFHGLDVSAHFAISLDIAVMIIPTLGGVLLAWCRARSGSLLLPIAVHGGMNEVANLIALVKAR
jgi:membrane protease YdiL (CAAX protease family)